VGGRVAGARAWADAPARGRREPGGELVRARGPARPAAARAVGPRGRGYGERDELRGRGGLLAAHRRVRRAARVLEPHVREHGHGGERGARAQLARACRWQSGACDAGARAGRGRGHAPRVRDVMRSFCFDAMLHTPHARFSAARSLARVVLCLYRSCLLSWWRNTCTRRLFPCPVVHELLS
jgi:hypothetical protein